MALSEKTQNRLIDLCLKYCHENYSIGRSRWSAEEQRYIKTTEKIQGQALSWLLDTVSDDLNLRYYNGRKANITEDDLVAAGFKIVEGRNYRNQRCRVVTL